MRRNVLWPRSGKTIALGLMVWLFLAPPIWADDTSMFHMGNDLLEEQNYPEALAAYKSFVEQNPEHRLVGAVTWTMANIHMTINEDYEKAAQLFQSVVAEHADTEWELFAYERLGRCYEELEQWEEAAQVYRPAIQKLSTYSGDALSPARIGQIKRRLLASYQNVEDHQSIIDMYQEMLLENPAAPSAAEDQFQLAQAYLNSDRPREAAENFLLVVERYSASPYAQRVHGEQADLLAFQLEYDWEPFSAFQSAQQLGQTGQYEESLSQFDQVIEANPDGPMAHAAAFQKHLVEYRKTGDAAALRRELSSGRGKYPYGPGVPVAQLNDILRGICEAQTAAKANPEDGGAYQQMGLGYYQTQAYQCGIDAYKQAIAIDPETPLAYNMLGYCCIGARKYEEAVSAFHQLVEVAPDDPNSYDSLAEGYLEKGDTTLAIQHYQKSLAVDSTFTNPYYMLGTIYQRIGQGDKAMEHLQRYLELDPNGFQSQNARSQLEQLESPSSEENISQE
jgi:tetratricopeptide (TPR) repeat protein